VTATWGRPRWSIRLRLTLWYGALFLVAGFLLLSINYILVSRNFPTERQNVRIAAVERLGLPVEVLNPGRELFQPPPDFRGERGGGFGFGEVFDGIALEVRNETLKELVIQSSLALGMMAFVSVGLGWFVAGRMLRPVHEISATVREISDQQFDRRVELGGPKDELNELAEQFNVMLDRLQHAFEAQREFVSNAAHELRTPLTIIRTELDVADPQGSEEDRAASAAVLRRAVARSEELIDRLLILARADAGIETEERVSLPTLVDEALADLDTTIQQHTLEVRVTGESVEVPGDRVLLGRLVGNLIENAALYNREGGTIEVTLSNDTAGPRLVVANDGELIDRDEVDRLFARFARGERSRSRDTGGTGLGLAIVRAIALAHDATVTAEPRDEGGLTITVTWPPIEGATG
jgi:signal transduction histidine kinase